MQLEDYFDFLAPNDIRLKGRRIGIETILFDYLDGVSAEEIALRYSHLSLEQVHATITYYWRNQAQIDAYLHAAEDHEKRMIAAQEANPSPALRHVRELLQRRRAKELTKLADVPA